MQSSWIKKTLSLMLALALTLGAFALLPAGALATGNEYRLNPNAPGVDAGAQKAFAVELADTNGATPVNTPVKYVWSAQGGTLVSGGGESDIAATYQFDTAGSASVSCELFALDATTGQPAAASFETVSASVTVNAVATAPAAPAQETSGGTSGESTGSTGGGTVISTGDSGSIGVLALTPGTAGVEITNKKTEFTSKQLASGYPLGLNVASGFKIISAKWNSTSPTVIKIGSSSITGATLLLGTIGMSADPFTIDVSCVVQDTTTGAKETVTDSFDVDKVTPSIAFTTAESEMAVDQTRTIKVEKYPKDAQITFESDSDAVNVDPTTATRGDSAKLTAKALSTSAVKITAKFLSMETVSDEYSISSVTGKAPTLSWKQSTMSVTAGKQLNLKNYLNYTSGLTLTFEVDGSAATIDADTGVLSTTAGTNGTVTVSVSSAATGIYRAAGPVKATVYVGTNSRITASPATMKLAVGGTDLAAITKLSGAGDWVVTSSNESVADVAFNSTDDSAVITINGYKTGTAIITVRAENSTASATIHVTVGTPTTGVSVNFFSSDNKTTTLTRGAAWGTMQVTVADYNVSYPYVTLTRSNIRTYVREGSYTSHPQSNSWVAKLSPSANDPTVGVATLYVVGQYNGSTYYTAAHTYATSSTAVTGTSPTIYVSGFAALPQTGPDYTWAYVLGGLCLAAVATAVTLNVKRKKKQQDN